MQKWCEGTSHSLGRLKVFSLFLNKGLFPRFGLSDVFCISLLPLPLPLGSPSSVLLGQGSFLICFMSSSKIPFFPFVRNFGEKFSPSWVYLRVRKVSLRGCFFGNVDLRMDDLRFSGGVGSWIRPPFQIFLLIQPQLCFSIIVDYWLPPFFSFVC